MTPSVEDNLNRANALLARFRESPLQHYIGGRATLGASRHTAEILLPVDNSVLGQLALGTPEDVDTAAQAAAQAFSSWSATPGTTRRKILHAIADLIESRAEEIALLEAMDTGQPIRYMNKAAVRAADNFRFFADRAPEARDGLSMPAEQHINYTVRQAIGPIGVITPWNTPFMLSTWKIAPAIAAGCTVVHKPAEWSPLTATLLAEICTEAGLPPGVLNTVHGTGDVAGRALTEHQAIKAIAFVGESATGQRIQAQGAPTLKRVHFELGGKNPVLVFDDCDRDRALDAVLFMIYSLNGERCTSSSRLLVQRSMYREFVDAVAERVRSIAVGHPLDPATEIGPLIHAEHCRKVVGYFETARDEGAEIQVGGRIIDGPGNFVAPTLISNATNLMRVSREEIFGPVLCAIPFDDEADAVRQANDTCYGLAAYLWTENVGRAVRVADAIDAGMVWVNSENNRHLPAPFGGMKASGIGRDGGDYSFDFLMETKNVCIAHGTHRVPRIAGGA